MPPVTGSSLAPGAARAGLAHRAALPSSPLLPTSASVAPAAPSPPLPSALCRQPAPCPSSSSRAVERAPHQGSALGSRSLSLSRSRSRAVYTCPARLRACSLGAGTEPFALLFCREPRGGRGSPLRGQRLSSSVKRLRSPLSFLWPLCELPGRRRSLQTLPFPQEPRGGPGQCAAVAAAAAAPAGGRCGAEGLPSQADPRLTPDL